MGEGGGRGRGGREGFSPTSLGLWISKGSALELAQMHSSSPTVQALLRNNGGSKESGLDSAVLWDLDSARSFT